MTPGLFSSTTILSLVVRSMSNDDSRQHLPDDPLLQSFRLGFAKKSRAFLVWQKYENRNLTTDTRPTYPDHCSITDLPPSINGKRSAMTGSAKA